MRLPLERMHDWCRRSASPVPATAKRLPLSSQMGTGSNLCKYGANRWLAEIACRPKDSEHN